MLNKTHLTRTTCKKLHDEGLDKALSDFKNYPISSDVKKPRSKTQTKQSK